MKFLVMPIDCKGFHMKKLFFLSLCFLVSNAVMAEVVKVVLNNNFTVPIQPRDEPHPGVDATYVRPPYIPEEILLGLNSICSDGVPGILKHKDSLCFSYSCGDGIFRKCGLSGHEITERMEKGKFSSTLALEAKLLNLCFKK